LRREITDDLDALLGVLPLHIQEPIYKQPDCSELIEVVLDLGRTPEARFPHRDLVINSKEVSHNDIDYVVSRVGEFTGDNRAGIERTLHRISAIRNRNGYIIGLTCRVGRAVFGTAKLIQDLVESGKSVLLLGKPGIGKTTMLREVARVLADDLKKRVIVIDTSNEIAGDGDIPHPAIGHARRMQVATPNKQHAVMIEAVENHMPEVIIIDEIGTELEAQAARTIAERGVQLIGTAHGNTLENLIMNPTLSDLVGGIQTVTLGDEEARRRRTQKSILERKAPPTFDVVVEIVDYYKVAVHPSVTESVDAVLHQQPTQTELRWLDKNGTLHEQETVAPTSPKNIQKKYGEHSLRFYLFGANRSRLEKAAEEKQRKLKIVNDLKQADLFLTTKSYYTRKPQKIRDAETLNIPIYVLKSNNTNQMRQCLDTMYPACSSSLYAHQQNNIAIRGRGNF
jgi:stage III sporulation protein SpoIIIAA